MNAKAPRSFYGENPLSPHAKWALAIAGVAAAVCGGIWYYEKNKTTTWTAQAAPGPIVSGKTYRFSFDSTVVDSSAFASLFPTATAYNVSGSPLPADWPASDPNKSNANAVFYQGVASGAGSFGMGVTSYVGS